MVLRNLPYILIGNFQLVVNPHLAHSWAGQRDHDILRRQLGARGVNHQGAHFFGVRDERDVQIGALLIRVRKQCAAIRPGPCFLRRCDHIAPEPDAQVVVLVFLVLIVHAQQVRRVLSHNRQPKQRQQQRQDEHYGQESSLQFHKTTSPIYCK